MESFLPELGKKIPELAALCFIVWSFLRYITTQKSSIESMHREHLDARLQSREAIKDNTHAMCENTRTMQELCTAIREYVR